MHDSHFTLLKIKNNMKLDFTDLVKQELQNQERNYKWLERKTNIPYSTLYGIFVQKTFSASKEKVALINKALGTSFTND